MAGRTNGLMVCFVFATATAVSAQDTAPVLRLRDAVAEALRASPTLGSAEDRIESARIQRRLAESRFGVRIMPNINAGTAPGDLGQRAFGVDISKRTRFGTELTTSVNSLSYGTGAAALHDAGYTVGVTQPLFRGATSSGLDLDRAGRETAASARTLADARQQLAVTTAERYFAVVKAR